ncbi:ribonuclease D, partial [SAR86 cluster bacterium]|nr:ribonuclease D [SAR86 cluster bacterium]
MLLSKIKNYFENNFYRKFNFSKKEILYVDNNENMNLLIKDLSKSEIIGIDTEFDWRKTYYPKLSLLQMVIGKKIYIVDCISMINLSLLKKFLEDPKKLIVFHSSRSDITVLKTNLNIKLNNLFDIQIAEKFINGGEIKNYGFIVLKYLGYKLDKSETNSNWLKRPLTVKQLNYAAEDVKFLLSIHKKQLKILKKLNKDKDLIIEFRKEAKLGNQELYISRLKKLRKASKEE